jgi:hypothetical protein
MHPLQEGLRVNAHTAIHRMLCLALAAHGVWLAPAYAQDAAKPGALVIAEQSYAKRPAMPACAGAAAAVVQVLEQRGYAVRTLTDATAINIRVAIDAFANSDQAGGLPPVIYACAAAVAIDDRLFLAPSDADAGQADNIRTQGVILKALVQSLPHGQGAVFADLILPPGDDPDAAVDTLKAGVAGSQHLALALGQQPSQAPLGAALAAAAEKIGPGLDEGWTGLVTAIRASDSLSASPELRLAIMPDVPPPSPAVRPEAAPPLADAPSPTPAPPTPVPAQAKPEAATQAVPPASPVPVPSRPAVTVVTPRAKPPLQARNAPRNQSQRPSPQRTLIETDQRIARLQIALLARGYYHGAVTGVANPDTAGAIRTFQGALGHGQTGALRPDEVVTLLNGR